MCMSYLFKADVCLFFLLTHLPLDKMAVTLQTLVLDSFSWMNNFVFWVKFHWFFLSKGPFDNNQSLVKIMAWRQIGDKPSSEPMLTRLTDAYVQH